MIHIFTTGGSIDKTYVMVESDFLVGSPVIDDVLREANIGLPYTITPLMRKDSLALTDDDRAEIVRQVTASPHTQILITHGTDTMPLTAKALMPIVGKTIVLTGAMQPAAFKHSDAPFNVGFALAAVQLLPAGIYITMNGRVLAGDKAVKNMEKGQFE
jgi:L-asparaginase